MSFLKAAVSVVIAVLFFGALALGAGYLWFQSETTKPGPSVEATVFVVKPGEGLGSIAARLENESLIRDKRVLRMVSQMEGTAGQIKAGEYLLEPGLSIRRTLEKLVEGDAILHRITVPEGLTVAQSLRIIAADPILTGEMPEDIPAEGSLLPDTYFFGRGMTRKDMIKTMVEAQTKLLDELWAERQEGLPFQTPYEAVILASVVEKETGLPAERPQIAGLFVGRLKKGMRLQSDPTIIYGVSGGEPLVDNAGNRRGIRQSEIDGVTDWNTYQIDGLPKTPICNPGRDAIAAVLDPPSTEYVFFVADGKGGHLFARTNSEHHRNVALYRKYEREELARERANR